MVVVLDIDDEPASSARHKIGMYVLCDQREYTRDTSDKRHVWAQTRDVNSVGMDSSSADVYSTWD
jgi:hypothetical protein